MNGSSGRENTSMNFVISSDISGDDESSDESSSVIDCSVEVDDGSSIMVSLVLIVIFISRKMTDQHFEIFSTKRSSLEVVVVRFIDSGVMAISTRRGTDEPGLRFRPAHPGNPTATYTSIKPRRTSGQIAAAIGAGKRPISAFLPMPNRTIGAPWRILIRFSGQLEYADGLSGGLMENEQFNGVFMYSAFAAAESFVVKLPVHERVPRRTHSTNFD